MDYDILTRYVNEDCNTTPLSSSEEITLIKKYHDGDLNARRRIVESNLRFVIKLAMNYRNQGLSLADLIQEGCVGLIEALDKFDLSKNCRLITYASWWIRLYMQRSIEQKSRQVNLPINKLEILRKVRAFETNFIAQNGRMPYLDEIASALDIEEKKLNEVYDNTPTFQTLHHRDEEHPGMERVLIDEDATDARTSIWSEEAEEILAMVMNHLTPRERDVLTHRFNLNGSNRKKLSLRKVGQILGLSAEGVRRIEEQAMSKLRRPLLRQRVEALFAA